jgi:4-hydroxybenzoate polyprenyltransferase
MQTSPDGGVVADAQRGNWVDRYAPEWLKPYARMARWDRPIGFWLLFWPCGFGIGLAAIAFPQNGFDWRGLILMFLGSILMRGAGCTFNDIVDRDIDAKVARTRSRPIPSGRVKTWHAAIFLAVQVLLGLLILLQFNLTTIILGIVSLLPVVIYPFMKRITWWPQLFLGVAFSWGALVGWTAETNWLSLQPLFLYIGSILWVIGYDTIYALQDIEDDALIGVKSTARLFGPRTRPIVALFYAGAVVLWGLAGLAANGGPLFAVGLIMVAGMLAWQVWTLDASAPNNPWVRFNFNRWVGFVLTAALMLEWWQ